MNNTVQNNTVRWTAPTGEVITFQICDYYDDWKDVGGIYMMCKFNNLQNMWEPVYIGKADSFKNRLSAHEKWLPACHLGARNVLAVVESSENGRDVLERLLIQYLDPQLNKQLKSPALGLGIFRRTSLAPVLGAGFKQLPELGLGTLEPRWRP